VTNQLKSSGVRWLLNIGVAILGIGVSSVMAQALTVSAAASLRDAFTALAPGFEQAHSGAKLTFNFAGSGALLGQIAQGAPVDVFASADQATMDKGVNTGVVDATTRRDFCSNRLVLVVPGDGAAPASGAKKFAPRTLNDLADRRVQKIAIGSPSTVPAGRYATEAVQAAGLEVALQAKLIYSENVRQVLTYVARAEVDAGFVYRTDALLDPTKTPVAFAVATPGPINYPVAVVAGTKNPALAKAFAAYLVQPAAQSVLLAYGFGKP
jgi:molybdate transport system substrate-binding protein